MNTKVLSAVWFVGGSIFGIVLAYTLGTQTVFDPMEQPVAPVANSGETNTTTPPNTLTLKGEIIVAKSDAPTIDSADFGNGIPVKKAFSLKTDKSVDGVDIATAELFAATPFRTVAVAYATSSESNYRVVVASTRNTEPNHDMCGSIYSASHACYFFLEPESIADLSEKTVYLGSLQAGGFNPDSLTFTSTSTVEFVTGEGDAGFSVSRVWELDLNKQTITLKKETQMDYNVDSEEPVIKVRE